MSSKLQTLVDYHTLNTIQTVHMGHDGLKNKSRKLTEYGMGSGSERRCNIGMKMIKAEG